MHETQTNTFDFKAAFSHNEYVRSSFLMDFIHHQDFKVVVLEVAEGNPYIEAGQSPTGVGDLDYSKKIKIIHIETGTEQILNQDPDFADLFHLK